MTMELLKSYKSICRQIKILEDELNISGLKGVDTTKPSVQSGKISNPTENAALSLLFSEEYQRQCSQRNEIIKFIFSIKDQTTKEMALRYAFEDKNLEDIARITNYDSKTVSRKLNFEIKKYNKKMP